MGKNIVHCTGVQIDITGTEGVLRVTNSLAFQNKEDNFVEGMNGDAITLSPLEIPSEYQFLDVGHLDVSSQDVAYHYDAYAKDRKNGTSNATTFKDALRQHYLIDQIEQTSESFLK